MGSFKQAFQICRIYFFQEWKRYKNYCLLSILAVFIGMYMGGIINYVKETGVRLSPWIFPFIMAKRELRTIIYACYGFFISSAISDNGIFNQIIIRSTYKTYHMGKLLCIAFLSLFYTIYSALVGILLHFPYIQLQKGWGKVLYTTADKSHSGLILNTLTGNIKILQDLTPLSGMLLETLLLFLTSFLLGIIIYFFSEIIHMKRVGIFICSFLIMLDFASEGILYVKGLLILSPLTWSNLSLIKIKKYFQGPSIQLCISILLTVIISICLFTILGKTKGKQ